MPDLTPKGVPYANPADPNDLTLHTQGLADWIDANPGVAPVTTAGRDALTGADLWDGRVVLNLTTGQLERYDAAATLWRATSVTDHGALTGLADDDHPQYLTTSRHDTPTRHGSTVVDHGSIGGLGDDDHPQYAKKTGDTLTGRLTLKTYRETVTELLTKSGTVTINPTDATMFVIGPNGPVTFAFAGMGQGDSFELRIYAFDPGYSSITWPAGIYWKDGAPPDLAAGKHHILVFWYDSAIWGAYVGEFAQ